MRHEQVNNSLGHFEIDYPERICLAYNYNSLTIQHGDMSGFNYDLIVDNITIKAASYQGLAKVYLSKIFQLLFTNIPENCSRHISVTIKKGDQQVFSFNTTVLYANLQIGERVQTFGHVLENPTSYERHLTWFKNFPFTISFIALEGYEYAVRKDNEGYGAYTPIQSDSIQNDIIGQGSAQEKYVVRIRKRNDQVVSPFDSSFDYTFFQMGMNDTLIVCEANDAKCGYFFRWIDKRGFWMQYLFTKGTIEQKVDVDETTRSEVVEVNNLEFEMDRNVKLQSSRILHCAAVNLDSEHYDDVSSIASSLYVEMYVGRDVTNPHRDFIWMPVKVKSASYTKNEQKELNNIEISIEFLETTREI